MEFDVMKLSKKDRATYEVMTDPEKERFAKTWLQMENQKLRLCQYMRATKERNNREKKVFAEKERKERTHRLIERGAILESNIKDPLDFTSEQIGTIVSAVMRSPNVAAFIEDIRNAGE